MRESFELADEGAVIANRCAEPGYGARPEAQVASRSVEVYTESYHEKLAGRSSLGTGLAQIASRLLDQLATGGVSAPHGGANTAANPQWDVRGNRVPRDDSPLVSWKRVFAVSSTGSLVALVSSPVQTRSAHVGARIASV